MKLRKILSLCVSVIICLPAVSQAVLIGGIEFADGAISFADEVISYTPGSDVASPHNNPLNLLGVPDDEPSTSLGDGGELVIRFIDNSLIASGDNTLDLWIFEVGAVVERFNVSISTDNSSWIDLGNVSGQPTGIDIDSVEGVTLDTLYSYVRLRDDESINQTGSPFGEADIIAIGAISSGVAAVPVPAAVWLFGSGLLGLVSVARRKKT